MQDSSLLSEQPLLFMPQIPQGVRNIPLRIWSMWLYSIILLQTKIYQLHMQPVNRTLPSTENRTMVHWTWCHFSNTQLSSFGKSVYTVDSGSCSCLWMQFLECNFGAHPRFGLVLCIVRCFIVLWNAFLFTEDRYGGVHNIKSPKYLIFKILFYFI